MLASIYYPPVAEVFLGFRNEQIGRDLDGFGFLVPEKEKRRILGTIWSSSLFDGRSPKGHAALTTFVGGARQPQLTDLNDRDLQSMVLEELRPLLSITGDPVFASVTRWSRAIPQYDLGYQKILAAVENAERQHVGLFLCSNFRGGIAVGDCIMSSERTASRIMEFLNRRRESAVSSVANN
jgi:oxygen-dependent protoporphyrinogen oxidase